VLNVAGDRLAKLRPAKLRQDVLKPLDLGERRFDSVALNLVLHCLPGGMTSKTRVFDEILPHLVPGGRVFGSTVVGTVIGSGARHGWAARLLLKRLNWEGRFCNAEDSVDALDRELGKRFPSHRLWVRGSVALFEAEL
jgi:hypothetical protein